MKKLFTMIALALVTTLNVNAQYRRSWDFTNWSAATRANLIAGSDWSDIEKANATAPTDASKENCFWQVGSSSSAGETLKANGVVIPELQGLTFYNSRARALAIATNYDASSQYHSPAYLWLGSKAINYFTIPHVAPGTVITMGVESHKLSEARGVTLSLGHDGKGTVLTDPEGNTNAVPKTYEEQKWLVPTDATDTPNSDGTYDVCVTNTNGCHLYFIQVGDGKNEKVKVAYVYSSATETLADAPVYNKLKGIEDYDVVPFDVAGDVSGITSEGLREYKTTIISSSVPANSAAVAVLKNEISWSPLLNLNASLYNAWGLGEAVKGTAPMALTKDFENALLKDTQLEEDTDLGTDVRILSISNSDDLTGVKLGEYFANDPILAYDNSDEALAFIHTHNINHNGYVFLPLNNEIAGDAIKGEVLLKNALSALVFSKSAITAAFAPEVSAKLGNNTAKVTLSCNLTGSKIYYTLDGSDPTDKSTLYTEPFQIDAKTRVKAVNYADGYTPSAVVDTTLQVFPQAAAPAISFTTADDKAEITLTTDAENATIWYNFYGSTDTLQSEKYTHPFIIRDHAVVYAFVTSNSLVQSETASTEVKIPNDKVYKDIISHFDASLSGKKNGEGLFAGGKNAVDQKDEENPIITPVPDGDDITTYPLKPYQVFPEDLTDVEWCIKSRGQSVLWQSNSVTQNVGDVNGYNPASIEDTTSLATKNNIQFYKFISGQYNAVIESTKKFQGPFNVMTILGNGSDNACPKMEIQVSADGENWTAVGDTMFVKTPRRLWKKYNRLYDGTDEVYVRLAHVEGNSGCMCFDIYIMNEGELSKAEEEQLAAAIEEIGAAKDAHVVAIFDVNGVKKSAMKAGINIVKYSDGSVRKVIIK